MQIHFKHMHVVDDCCAAGVLLVGIRIKSVIPGSPGARPLVGRALQTQDHILVVDEVQVNAENIAEFIRGSAGTKVHLLVKRASTGAKESVVCVRAPLRQVEHCRDLHLLLEDAKANVGNTRLVSEIEDALKAMQDDNNQIVARQRNIINTLEKQLKCALATGVERPKSLPQFHVDEGWLSLAEPQSAKALPDKTDQKVRDDALVCRE